MSRDPSQNVTAAELIEEARRTLISLKQSGRDGFDLAPSSFELMKAWGQPAASQRMIRAEGTAETGEDADSTAESLPAIQADLGNCTRCHLSEKRQHIVFGAGADDARIVFVGEGPGAEEDRQGLPFVGAAGDLLTNIIKAMTFSRETVYICNIVKCRPPQNRNPTPDEIETCLPFLKRQLVAIQPDIIVTLGGVAAHSLLETTTPISRLRGRFQEWQGIPVMPTFHPAFLLRNPEKKREVWEDMKQVMRRLGISPEER